MALHPSIAAIIENREWVHALHRWHNEGSQALTGAQAPFGLSSDSWQALKAHLRSTGWFTVEEERVAPKPEGHELLYRARELSNLMMLEAKGQMPRFLYTEKPEGAAVDIGCGPGYGLLMIARLGFAPLYGYDLAPFTLEIAQHLLEREGKSACLVAGDATPLEEIGDGEAGLIYSRGALHYFDLTRLAQSCGRVLRPNGYVVVEVKALSQYSQFLPILRRRGPKKAIAYGMVFFRTLLCEIARCQPYLGAKTHEIGWTPRLIRRFAKIAGLEIVSCDYNAGFHSYDIVFRKAR
jgi:SAM-dependent methyltransferase